MSDPKGGEPKSKKRKLNNPNVVKVGNKVLSLEGYFNPPPKKAAVPKPAEEPTTSTTAEVQTTTHKWASDNPNKSSTKRQRDGTASTRPHKDSSAKDASSTPSSWTNGPRWREDPVLLKTRQQLPIWPHRKEIQNLVRKNDVVVLAAETGSGKSTQVPQFIISESWCRRKTVKLADGSEAGVGGVVAITQPRRVAATTLAHRVSREAGTPLKPSGGKGEGEGPKREGLVGYSVRFDHCVPKGTKIKFVTEGMLLQELLHDPHLRQYSAIVVDEIHERSVDVDLLSGFLKQILEGDLAGRGGVPLKVVVMSATADVETIGRFFSEPRNTEGETRAVSVAELSIPGRQFPVQTIHLPKAIPDLQDGLLKAIIKLHNEEPLPGDVLAFLTGQEEIEAAQGLIEEHAATLPASVPKIKVFPLFGQLSIEAQHEAFKPIKGGFTRKIVLATNIAETSVTVPGVRYVLDCGKAKVKQFRSRLGMESLLAKPISKSSAIQRTGRAGREGPGKCFRLYTEAAFGELHETDLPEMLRIDVLGAVLTMKARGIDDVLAFPLMDAPATDAIERALLHLHTLGALADDGSITPAGRKMAAFPIAAPLGAVLLAAARPQFDCVLEVIDVISALTSGDDIFHQLHSEEQLEEVEEMRKELRRREGDILTYLTTMQLYAAENADRVAWCRKRKVNIRNMRTAMNVRRQLRALCLREGLLTEAAPADPQPFSPPTPERAQTILKCFLRGFASKTAVLAPDASYVTSFGKHTVAIHPSSAMHGRKVEAILFLEHVYTTKSYCKKVSAIQANWIVEALQGEDA
ncbi:pre-mRNA-splicing factor ATP-dependent RNA helicase PRP43 [Plectosphaerella cucumerina]|uniref:RNA helicase n=1 Tax=Plectosphaerella cucumerina TaxID=40658 RepID=A0A8K0TVZ5_9PEZI|nr:pre-mRNA-splicing factor ATP-dependent RNA helicase PRP43 [Plectosphaerella cucumerina]